MMQKPNILFLFPDQMRADFLGCYGASFCKTPHIDSIAQSGVLYDRAVSPSPLCVPARASLLTGLNAIKNGVLDNTSWLRPDKEAFGIRTWPQMLAQAGYDTAAIGKMHFYPWDITEGFAHRRIAEDKRHIFIKDDYTEYLHRHGLRRLHGNEHEEYHETQGAAISRIPLEHQIDTWVGNETCDYLQNHDASKPFALMVGFPGPHCPYDPPKEFADMYRPQDMPLPIPVYDDYESFRLSLAKGNLERWCDLDHSDLKMENVLRIRAYYAALISQIDENVGRIINTLKEKNLYDNTVIIFAADHGDYMGDFGMLGKGTFIEPSIRVPLVISHPDRRIQQRVDRTVSLTDLYATLLSFAGISVSQNSDSIELPHKNGESGQRDYVFGVVSNSFMVTDNQWKFCRYGNGKVFLHDLKNDPDEQINYANSSDYSAVQEKLQQIMIREIGHSVTACGRYNFIAEAIKEGEGDFGKPRWKRPYPANVFN